MSIRTVHEGIAAYFGGPYDEATRTYRSSPLAEFGVGVVRRGWARDDNRADYFLSQAAGGRTGCQIVVYIPRSYETRVALGGEHGGMKRVSYEIQLACYIRSNTEHVEDAQDDAYALRDALVAWMHQDRTLGGAVFQAGEYIDGAPGGIELEYAQPEVKTGLTKQFLLLSFGAIEYVFA